MRPKALIFILIAIALSATASWFGSDWAVRSLERDTASRVNASLTAAGETWSSIETDGLIVRLTGEAPSETARFRALEVAARIVDTNRIDDQTAVVANANADIPDFSLEILRNGEELSLIGLVPGKASRLTALQKIEPIRNEAYFTDLMESIEFEPPEGWDAAMAFGIEIAQKLGKSRIVVRPAGVSVEAFFEDTRTRNQTERAIQADKPVAVALSLNFSAPRVVVAPFRFVVTKRNGNLSVSECWSDTETAKGRIYSAFSDNELTADCPEALGAPTPEWSDAIIASLAALDGTQNADVTITDLDVTFSGTSETDLERFEEASKKLDSTLPEIFSFRSQTPGHTASPEPRELKAPTFVAALAQDRQLTLSGPVRDTMAKDATEGFAAARFGDSRIATDLTVSANIPPGWSPRVLAALDALSLLHDGTVEMTMDGLTLMGRSPQEDITNFITEALSSSFAPDTVLIDVIHEPELALVETQAVVDARECERQLAGIMREAQIVFDPNSSTISEESEILLDEIAYIVSSCQDAKFEIGGHTDSQGREEMNLSLSQSRADAVLDALLTRDVLLAQLASKGYGESQPIADNETEDGRARNRRIAFKLVISGEQSDEQN